MKYIKLYEEIEGNDILITLQKSINWDMIEDVKDMALDGIDEGATLLGGIGIHLPDDDPVYHKHLFYIMYYNHYRGDISRYDNLRNVRFLTLLNRYIDEGKKLVLVYRFGFDKAHNRFNKELLARIKRAYPNENIRLI